MENKNLLIGAGAAVILIAAFLLLQAPTPSEPTKNQTVAFGDTVTVDYILKVKGEVVDTSLASVASANNITQQGRNYAPLTFQVLYDGMVINGFAEGVVGMKQGETKTFNVTPLDAYGPYNYSKVNKYKRYYNLTLNETVPKTYFTSAGINLWENRVIRLPEGFFVSISNVNESNVVMSYLFKQDDVIVVNSLPQKVVDIGNTTATLRIDVVENNTYSITDPTTGYSTSVKAISVTNNTFTMDSNHPYAGRNLEFTLTLNSVVKAQSS